MPRDPEEILARVRAIPEGFVCTYGDISPGAPRHAGAVLRRASGSGAPWWRVVRADGSLAVGAEQERLLRAEGVPFRGGRVELDVVRFPGEALAPSAQARAATPARRPARARRRAPPPAPR